MLETVDLDREVPKQEYRARLPALEWRLFDLERRARAAGVPSVLVFEGWETAGKGSILRVLTERLDPRAVRIHPIQDPQPHERERPWMWRFWMRLPNRGEMAIFDTSWYRHVLSERMAGKVKRREWEVAFEEIDEFERQITDDGTVLLKFFLHISKKEQRRRLERAEADPEDSLEPTREMWKQNRRYDEWLEATEEMLERTQTGWAPWTIVESHDRGTARLRVFETVTGALEAALARARDVPPPLPVPEWAREGAAAAASASAGSAGTAAAGDGSAPGRAGAGARGAAPARRRKARR